MILRTLPSFETAAKINAADLYPNYTALWIERDDWRSEMKPEGKRSLMWDLSVKMFRNNNFSVHYTQLDKPLVDYLKPNAENINRNEDYFSYETTTCTFLNRDNNGNYKFTHKSYMEYFLAEYIMDCVKKREPVDAIMMHSTAEIGLFIKLIVTPAREELKGLCLIGLRLSGIDLRGADLRDTQLNRADLSDALLSDAKLNAAYLNNAKLTTRT
jgi:hypothetical protein